MNLAIPTLWLLALIIAQFDKSLFLRHRWK